MIEFIPATPGTPRYLFDPVLRLRFERHLDSFATRPDPDEVASIHLLPLGELDRPDSPEMLAIEESSRPVIKVLIGDTHVHAPTAAVIHQFHEVVVHGRPTRVHDLEQPTWAWG